MKMYRLDAIKRLIARYIDKGGSVHTVREGVLGYGTTVLVGEGLKTVVIMERYLNEWSSGHTVRFYNKTPKKYMEVVC